jgi:predicted dithiol-disulfide oxidoreductase (DUF899 family)
LKTTPTVVSREEWLKARIELLGAEKTAARMRDDITARRLALPWVKVEKNYLFKENRREVSLFELFEDHSQLIVYHFMFDCDWQDGCKRCSFIADHYERSIVHLRQRDVAFVSVSRAGWEKLDTFKRKMNWTFRWVSSDGSDFNRDFGVSFSSEESATGSGNYNYRDNNAFPVTEAPGLSVFAKDHKDVIFHTYSCYGRGLENLIGTYHYLDLVPMGRNEGGKGMDWVRLNDDYP